MFDRKKIDSIVAPFENMYKKEGGRGFGKVGMVERLNGPRSVLVAMRWTPTIRIAVTSRCKSGMFIHKDLRTAPLAPERELLAVGATQPFRV